MPKPRVPKLYLVRDPKPCECMCGVCGRRPARAYLHPNPLRTMVRVYRCKRHNRVQFVPFDEKQGLGGGVYH